MNRGKNSLEQAQLAVVEAGARCGYCNRELVRRGRAFECARCAPLLAKVSTVEEWADFQRWAWETRAHPLHTPLKPGSGSPGKKHTRRPASD